LDHWWQADNTWIAVAITYSGLVALGTPDPSVKSFPEAFRQGMAARADQLRDRGANDPQAANWSSAPNPGQQDL